MQMLGFICRNSRKFNDLLCWKTQYYVLVRSILEYCSIIWNPYQSTLINKIENSFVLKVNYKFKNSVDSEFF